MKEVILQKEIAVISKDLITYLLKLDILQILSYESKQMNMTKRESRIFELTEPGTKEDETVKV